MPEYTFHGSFQITTDCADLEEITRSLNETARIFGDVIKWRTGKTGFMYLTNDVEIELPVKELGVEADHLNEAEEEIAPEDEAA